MTLWVLLAAIAVGVIAILSFPTLRRKANIATGADLDIAVYKDQLSELDRDIERGLINADDADNARLEIQRRILNAADSTHFTLPATAEYKSRILIFVLAVLIPIGGSALYLELGSPSLPDFPYAQRTDLQEEPVSADNLAAMRAAVTELEGRLESDPENAEGWLLLARSYLSMDRYEDAQQAFLKVHAITGDILIKAEYAEAVILANDSQVVPEAIEIFKAVLLEHPIDPKSRFYFGVAAVQQDDIEAALKIWVDLIHLSDNAAPWLPIVREHVMRAATELGTPPFTLKPSPEARQLAARMGVDSASVLPSSTADSAPVAPGPTQDDVNNAADMSAEEQDAMIRSMVQRLADRLKDNPDDREGWLRLGRAYEVLGETDKADEARQRASELTP